MQKHVNLVDLVKSFPTNTYLQNLASIQKRTSPVKFAHLAKKSGKGSVSNLSTKVTAVAIVVVGLPVAVRDALRVRGAAGGALGCGLALADRIAVPGVGVLVVVPSLVRERVARAAAIVHHYTTIEGTDQPTPNR